MSGFLWHKLGDERTPPGFSILGDRTFTMDTWVCGGKIIRAGKRNETQGVLQSVALTAVDIVIQSETPGEHQAAEWGIRAFKGPFGRLLLPLSADRAIIDRLLNVCVSLLNSRMRLFGLNQILNTYADPSSNKAPLSHLFTEEIEIEE